MAHRRLAASPPKAARPMMRGAMLARRCGDGGSEPGQTIISGADNSANSQTDRRHVDEVAREVVEREVIGVEPGEDSRHDRDYHSPNTSQPTVSWSGMWRMRACGRHSRTVRLPVTATTGTVDGRQPVLGAFGHPAQVPGRPAATPTAAAINPHG